MKTKDVPPEIVMWIAGLTAGKISATVSAGISTHLDPAERRLVEGLIIEGLMRVETEILKDVKTTG
jgi:hypothetical protein